MKAIIVEQFGRPEVLQMKDVEIPTVGPNDVLIRVAKTSVNFADVKKRKGTKKSVSTRLATYKLPTSKFFLSSS